MAASMYLVPATMLLVQVCMVYFHSVDVVLGRTDVVRRTWQARCHLPKIMFAEKRKHRKGSRTSSKLQNYVCFKRMIAVKQVVYERHQAMLRMYERYCHEAEMSKYWGIEEDDDLDTDVAVADDTNEADCDDGF